MTNTPVLSLVCGTYNRLPTLRRMIESVRRSWPLSLECVIADNGSDDGTYGWLQHQPDTRALQMGAPVGAIRAFTEAAKQARGDYVLLATDDVQFPPGALVRALRHLETHPRCGAVALAHDKYQTGTMSADYAPGILPDGQRAMLPYPQIALVRRWLGDRAGWWGGDDPIMTQGFTYGGDNYLGARIWELGYTVEQVPGAVEIEEVIEDGPRALNRTRHRADGSLYHQRFPGGFRVADTPQVDNPQGERLRVLLAQHYQPSDATHRAHKSGLRTALARYGLVIDYDYAGRNKAGYDVTHELAALADAYQPHLIVTQVHRPGNGMRADTLYQMRKAAPKAVAVNWNGDYWPKNFLEDAPLHLYFNYDLVLSCNAWGVETLCRRGVRAAYWPTSFEAVAARADAPAHDVVFLGNGYSDARMALARVLRGLSVNVGLYGRFKDIPVDGNTHYDIALSRGLYANARMAVSPMEFTQAVRGYVSNRLWEILAAGGAVALQQHSPGLDAMTGLRAGVHYAEWRTFDELRALVAHYQAHDGARQRMVEAARAFVQTHHSFEARVHQLLFEYLPRMS